MYLICQPLVPNFMLYSLHCVIMHCGFRFNKDEVMEMIVKAHLTPSDEECSNYEIWPDTGEGNQNLTEDANYQVTFSTKVLYTEAFVDLIKPQVFLL